MMQIAVFSALGLLLLVFFAIWLMTQIRYRITPQRLQVTLFSLGLRSVKLADIESISKRKGNGLAEFWINTTKPKHRVLVIRRSRGLFRNFIISPRNRYVVRSHLEKGMAALGASPNPGEELASISVE